MLVIFSNHKLGGSSEPLGSKHPITVKSSEMSGDITASGKLIKHVFFLYAMKYYVIYIYL